MRTRDSLKEHVRTSKFEIRSRHSKFLNILALLLCLFPSHPAAASIVSRLGKIYLYDPQTFDAGSLQRGAWVRGGAGTERGDLEAAIDLPFFRDFSLRLGYVQRIVLNARDGHPKLKRLIIREVALEPDTIPANWASDASPTAQEGQ